MNVPVELVAISDLWATQLHLSIEALLNPWDPEFSSDPYPHVVAHSGRLMLEDGHHRALRAALQGKTHLRVRMLVPPTRW